MCFFYYNLFVKKICGGRAHEQIGVMMMVFDYFSVFVFGFLTDRSGSRGLKIIITLLIFYVSKFHGSVEQEGCVFFFFFFRVVVVSPFL